MVPRILALRSEDATLSLDNAATLDAAQSRLRSMYDRSHDFPKESSSVKAGSRSLDHRCEHLEHTRAFW